MKLFATPRNVEIYKIRVGKKKKSKIQNKGKPCGCVTKHAEVLFCLKLFPPREGEREGRRYLKSDRQQSMYEYVGVCTIILGEAFYVTSLSLISFANEGEGSRRRFPGGKKGLASK